MNSNPGRGFLLDVERQSSPIRHRGYVNPASRSSPPLRAGIAAGNQLLPAEDSTSTLPEEQRSGSGSVSTMSSIPLTETSDDLALAESSSSEESVTSDENDDEDDLRPINHTTLPSGFNAHACKRKDSHFQQILRHIKQLRGYTVGAFMRDCIHYKEDANSRAAGVRLGQIITTLTHPSTKHAMNTAATSRHPPLRFRIVTGPGVEMINKEIKRELRRLRGHHPFVKWSTNVSPTFDDIDIPSIVRTIEMICPTWYSVLVSTFVNERAHHLNHRSKRKDFPHRIIYIITSMAMLRQASQKAGFAATQFGLYLRAVGMKDAGIDVLSRFGLCPTVDTIRKKEKYIETLAKNDLQALPHGDQPFVICYDNFDFTNRVRDQAMGSLSQLEHWTTAYAFTAHHLEAHSELKQIHLDYARHLSFKDVVTSTIRSAEMLSEWPSHLVHRALDHVLKDHFRTKLRQWKIEFPRPSASNCLPPTPTKIVHFAAADANSGSIDGTYQVHEHLIGSGLGLDLEDDGNPAFQQRMQLVYGDQKTIENIQSTKSEQQESISLYDRRRWLLPVPGLFHVQMNLGGVILRKHWAPNEAVGETSVSQDTRHGLLRDIQFLGYKGLSQERAPWHSLDALINVSFNARVLATWLQCLEYKGTIDRSSIINEDSLYTFVRDSMDQSEFEDSLKMAQDILFSNDARKGDIPSAAKPYIRCDVLKWPNHMITLARFMQPMKAYLIFRFAIKYGNLKAIECVLPLLILLFLGSNKHKCGKELLYLMWILHYSVSDEKLRNAIASTLVINISGRGDSFIPPDRHMEHINRLLQDDINAHKNSTHDWTTILRTYALLAPYYGKLRKGMEQAVGYKVSTKHSNRSTSFDVFSMALQMLKDGDVDWNNRSSGQFLCDHVVADGAILLPSAVDAFNRDVVDKQAGGMSNIPNSGKEPGEDADDDEEWHQNQEIEEEVFVTEECLNYDD